MLRLCEALQTQQVLLAAFTLSFAAGEVMLGNPNGLT